MPTSPTFPGGALADGWSDVSERGLPGVRILVRERLVVVLIERAALWDVVATVDGRVKVAILMPTEVTSWLRALAAEIPA